MDTINVFDVDSFFASSQEIKREDLGIPLVPSPEEQTLTTKRKGTKRGQDPQEIDKRNTRRRENQKVACRNYRMRKKEYLSELQAKIQQLEEEKEQLTKENMSYKMNNNNNNYNNNNSPAVDPNVANAISEVARVLSEMQEALNVPTEDSMLEYLLQAFFVTTSKLHNAFLKDVDDLVNPFTQVSLASLGYMPSMDIPEISPIQMGGLWDTFITSANLTQEQGNRLQGFISKITNTDAELRMERGAIDNQIKQFYLHKLRVLPLLGTSTQPSEQLDTKTILEFTWLLNRLKTNIVSQKSLLLNTHPQLSNILTPRQHVTLLVNVCQSRFFEWPYHAQVLRTAWDYVSRSSSSSLEASSIALHHPLSPLSPLSSPSSPYSSPYDPSSPQYMSPPSPPTVVPSIAIPTPVAPFSTTYTFLPTSPSLTPTCAPQISTNANSSIVQSFLTSLNYGVH